MAKSFAHRDKDELLAAAEYYGVDLDTKETIKTLAAKLAEDGITPEDWDKVRPGHIDGVQPDEVEQIIEAPPSFDEPSEIDVAEIEEAEVQEEEPEAKEDEYVLVIMTRKNVSYEILGYRFTRAHPFMVVKADDANYLIENEEGFRLASPAEAKQFYS